MLTEKQEYKFAPFFVNILILNSSASQQEVEKS